MTCTPRPTHLSGEKGLDADAHLLGLRQPHGAIDAHLFIAYVIGMLTIT